MQRNLMRIAALSACVFMAGTTGQAEARQKVTPVWNCGSCHQQAAGEIWGTLVPGSQTNSVFQVQTDKDTVWSVRYDQKTKLKKLSSLKDLADEKAVRVKVSDEGGNKGYAQEVSYKSKFKFKKLQDVISVGEVAELLKKSPEEGNYVLFDARGYDNYIEGHLPGAVLLPHYRLQEFKDRLPKDKNTLIVAYCRGGS